MGKVNFAQFQKTKSKEISDIPEINLTPEIKFSKQKNQKQPQKEIDLRDEIDNFVSWIKKTDVKNFTGKREAVIKRIKEYKRPSLIEGTIELLVKFMKESNIKSIRI